MVFCNVNNCGNGGGFRGNRNAAPTIDDGSLSAELNQLSVQEREHIYEVVHGVADTRTHVNEEFLQAKIVELKKEIQNIPQRKRRHYDRAIFLKPSLENDVRFHLRFMWADDYEAHKAAQRICMHFANKTLLFGDGMLANKITIDDLDEDDMYALTASANQALKSTDRSGRKVWLTCMPFIRFKHWKNIVRFPNSALFTRHACLSLLLPSSGSHGMV